MKFQLSLDDTNLERAIREAYEARDSIDIIGLSGRMIHEGGYGVIRRFAEIFPELDLLADLKLVDCRLEDLEAAYQSGAGYVTLSGDSSERFIREAARKAESLGGKVIVELAESDQTPERIEILKESGADYITLSISDPEGKRDLQSLLDSGENLHLDDQMVTVGHQLLKGLDG